MTIVAASAIKKPFFRGKLHRVCQYLVIAVAPVHLLLTSGDAVFKASLALFYICNLFLFFVSSIYHFNYWRSEELDLRVTAVDKSAIFFFIGSCYTCLSLIFLPKMPNIECILAAVWGLVIIGVIKAIILKDLHRAISISYYTVVFSITVPLFPALLRRASKLNSTLYIISILSTLAGGTAYGLQYPDPFPKYFGYHEIFHLGQVVGNVLMLLCFSL